MPYLIQSDEFRLIRELGRLFNLRKGEFQPGPPENHERVSSDVEFIDFELRHAFTFKDFPRNLELAEFEQCQGKLKCLCLLLEGLVSDQYTQKPPHGVEDQILAYPRLRKLIHHMQSTSGVLDLVYGCNKSIFSLPHGSDLANCLRVINECNGAFRRLHAPPAQAATLNNSAKREQKRKWKKARIRNRATFVLDGVFRHFRCGTQHEVLLKLFEDPDENLELPSLELVFSRCPDSRLLQEVRCGSVILYVSRRNNTEALPELMCLLETKCQSNQSPISAPASRNRLAEEKSYFYALRSTGCSVPGQIQLPQRIRPLKSP
jgi:hypothetical protein